MKNLDFKSKCDNKKDGFNGLFGYLENDDYGIYSYIKKENEVEDDTLLETIINISIEEFQNNPEYSMKNIKNIIYTLNEKILEVNIENIEFSMLYIVTDYNSLVYMSCGSLSLNLIRNDNILISNLLDENFIGINKSFYINTTKENIYFVKNDRLVICSKNLLDLINMYEKLENLEINTTTSYILSSLEVVEVLDRSLFVNKPKYNIIKYLFIIIILVLIYFFVINLYISMQYKEIDKLDNKFKIAIEGKNLLKSKEYLNEEIILLKNLDKKYIFISKKDALNKLNKKIQKESILEKLNLIEVNLRNIEIEKENIKNRKFENVLKEYIKLENILDIFPEYFLKFKEEVEVNIEEITRLINNQKKEKESIFSEDRLFMSIKDLKEIIEVYKNSKFKINVIDLENKLNEYVEIVEKYKLKVDEDIVNVKILQNENITLAEKKLIEIKNNLEALEDNIRLKEVDEILVNVREEIKYNKDELEKNFNQGLIEYENKNYEDSIEYFKYALNSSEKLNNLERAKEIKDRIRYISKKIEEKRQKENIIDKNIKNDENIKKEIMKSIMLSIQKGDEYLKNNEFKNAYIEYKRAMDMSNKINIDKTIKNKTQKKIEYIKNKLNKKWWELWK